MHTGATCVAYYANIGNFHNLSPFTYSPMSRRCRTALVNPWVRPTQFMFLLSDSCQQQIARPQGDLNPCLRPDTSQLNCIIKQPVDPNITDDPLSHHVLQDKISMDELLRSVAHQPHVSPPIANPLSSQPHTPSHTNESINPMGSYYTEPNPSDSIYHDPPSAYPRPHLSSSQQSGPPSYSSDPMGSTSYYTEPHPSGYPNLAPSAYPGSHSSSSQ